MEVLTVRNFTIKAIGKIKVLNGSSSVRLGIEMYVINSYGGVSEVSE